MDTDPLAATKPSSAEISGFVLVGGRSSRLGRDKVLLPWNEKGNGRTLLDHAVFRLRQVCGTVKVCADRDDLAAYQPLIRDAVPDAGPLSAMVAALEQSETEWNLFLAVDLPLIPVEFLRALAARAMRYGFAMRSGFEDRRPPDSSSGSGVRCIVPLVEDIPQPLCGIYHRSLTSGLRRALLQGEHKIMLAIRQAADRQPGPPAPCLEMWKVQDIALVAQHPSSIAAAEWFLNLNTTEDWQRIRELRSRITSPLT